MDVVGTVLLGQRIAPSQRRCRFVLPGTAEGWYAPVVSCRRFEGGRSDSELLKDGRHDGALVPAPVRARVPRRGLSNWILWNGKIRGVKYVPNCACCCSWFY